VRDKGFSFRKEKFEEAAVTGQGIKPESGDNEFARRQNQEVRLRKQGSTEKQP
jgi:hypothetical protein